MRTLDLETWNRLRQGGDVLESDRRGEKVVRLVDGSIVKLFRRKRLLSSAMWRPYAVRFARNAKGLHSRGIPVPEVLEVWRLPFLKRTAVHYRPLEGRTLRQLAPDELACLWRDFGSFIARLHESGVYFRSLHLGNVVQTPPGDLGLIDFADMSLKCRPLCDTERLRNFRHLLQNRFDQPLFGDEVRAEILAGYGRPDFPLP